VAKEYVVRLESADLLQVLDALRSRKELWEKMTSPEPDFASLLESLESDDFDPRDAPSVIGHYEDLIKIFEKAMEK
jgi:hypothetical protein